MTTLRQFMLPDVGEGLTDAEISTWTVAVGDIVEVNQMIVEIETAKSLVELPSPFAGVVSALHAAEGETVAVGRPIITISTGATADAENPVSLPPDDTVEDDEPKLLVGYGAKETSGRRRRRRPAPATAVSAAPVVPNGAVKAAPPVRKLAKDLGVELRAVTPSGPDSVVTLADVVAASSVRRDGISTTPPPASEYDVRIPIKGVRKHMAAAMVTSAFTAPHVTEFVTVDVTKTMELRLDVAAREEFADIKLSPLTFVARAFLQAMQRTPASNSRWDDAAQEIVQMREINLGIAAATPRGLVVPNIFSAQRLSLAELAQAINDLAATARRGKTAPEAMSGGTVTISNFGVFGIDSGTPILNPGEAAILGVGTIARRPWVVGEGINEGIAPRWVTTLALSFDHRIMDGAQGSQLLADTAAFLREPALALL